MNQRFTILCHLLCAFYFIRTPLIEAQRTTVTQSGVQNIALVDSVKALPIDSVMVWMQNNYTENLHEYYDISQHALTKYLAKGNDSLIATCYLSIADWYAYNGEYSIDSTVVNQEKALAYFVKSGNKDLEATTKVNLSVDYINAGRLDLSQKVLFEAVDYFKKDNNEERIASCQRIIAMIALREDRYEESIRYADESIDIYRKLDDYYKIGLNNFTKIDALNRLERFDEALEAANECMDIALNKIPEETFFGTRAYEYRGEVYFKMGNYDLALKDLKEGYRIMVEAVGEERAEVNKLMIGNTLCKMGKYQEGIKNMELALNISDIKGQSMVKDLYKDLSECYEKVGDYANAHRNFKTYERLDKETLNSKIANLEEEALIKYETDLKNEEIASQEVELAQQSKIQTLYLGLAVLFGLMLLSLWYNFIKNKKTTALLAKKNMENELLLKEIHHRVKNNLQTVSSLLSLQSSFISDPAALDAVQESKNRVASMALIHQKLYQGENLAAVEMRDYFNTIGSNIKNSFGSLAADINVNIEMLDLELDVDTAVPIGLITNELVTNSIKYAFKESRKGNISIQLKQSANGLFQLSVSDDGLASKDGQNLNRGFGSMLIELLTKQLGGELKMIKDRGTTTVIDFHVQEKSAA